MSENKVQLSDYEASEYAVEFEESNPQEVLEWALGMFHPRISVACSLQAEDVILLDMVWKIDSDAKAFVIDTGRLHEADYELMNEIKEKYGNTLEVYTPTPEHIYDMVKKYGINLFYESVPLRMLCCQIRKVVPLTKALKDLDAWITGLRRSQWASRHGLKKIEIDHEHEEIVKINPLADWGREQVWDYIEENDVPTNRLYDEGYKSIGCAPCTRPVSNDENPRAGRWWWEGEAPKECGMHCSVEFGGFEKYERAVLGDEEESK